MRVRVRDDVAKSKIVERASSRDRTKAREGLLRTATGSLQPDLPAKSSQFGTCRPTARDSNSLRASAESTVPRFFNVATQS